MEDEKNPLQLQNAEIFHKGLVVPQRKKEKKRKKS
jgi:hypothetical protein